MRELPFIKEPVFQVWKSCLQLPNFAIDYLVNHSSEDISDVIIAFLALENVDFYILYAILPFVTWAATYQEQETVTRNAR